MNFKKKLLILFICCIYSPKAYSMLSLIRQLPRVKHHIPIVSPMIRVQKRNTILDVMEPVMAPLMASLLAGVACGCLWRVVATTTSNFIIRYRCIRSDECFNAYTTQANACSDPLCCKDYNDSVQLSDKRSENFLKIIDQSKGGRLKFVEKLNERYDQLCLTEEEIVEAFWCNTATNTPTDVAKYHHYFELLAHKKECINKKMLSVKDDMRHDHYQKRCEQELAAQLGLALLPDKLQQDIEKKTDKIQRLLVDISNKHQKPSTVPVLKMLKK